MDMAKRLARQQLAALLKDLRRLTDDAQRLHEVVDHILIGLECEEQEQEDRSC